MHWRHEQLSLRMALAAATHHSAQPRAKEGWRDEAVDASALSSSLLWKIGGRRGAEEAEAEDLEVVYSWSVQASTSLSPCSSG